MVNYSRSVNSPVSGFWAGHRALLWWCLVLGFWLLFCLTCVAYPVSPGYLVSHACALSAAFPIQPPIQLWPVLYTNRASVLCGSFFSFLSIYLARVNCRHDASCSSCVGKAASAFLKAQCAAAWCINNCIDKHLFPFSLYFQLPYLLQWRMRQSFGEFTWKEEN